jgi:hypothetical protein
MERVYNRSDLLEDSVRGIQAALTKAVEKYNTYRPHKSLKEAGPSCHTLKALSKPVHMFLFKAFRQWGRLKVIKPKL